MKVQSEITICRPRQEVFDYIARAEYLPAYIEDFAIVRQVSEGEPAKGTEYSYEMKRGAGGTFSWVRFEPTSHLAWEGPATKMGPGSMEPAGWWDLSDGEGGTQVKLVMAPKPGGLFKLLAPFMAAGMRKGNSRALERLKERLEQDPAKDVDVQDSYKEESEEQDSGQQESQEQKSDEKESDEKESDEKDSDKQESDKEEPDSEERDNQDSEEKDSSEG